MAQGNRTVFTNSISSGIYPSFFQEELSQKDLTRMRKESTHWKFYLGNQWKSGKRGTEENRNTINYCKSFIDKGVAFLFGKGFQIDVKDAARDVTLPVLNEVWEDNDKELKGLDIGQSGGVTGNAWVKVTVDEYDEEEEPDLAELYPQGRIKINVLPSYSVYPEWDAHDRDRMVKCKIMYPIITKRERGNGEVVKSKKLYKEVITRDTITEYIGEEKVRETENPLNEIPVVRIKNLPHATSALGLSDIEDILPLQRELNYKSTDISDIINYHAAPITIVQGAKARNLEKGSRKVWGGIPKDGKVYNLTLDSDLKAALNYINLIKTSMFELASMPEDAFGKEMNVSNTSGVALHIKNQPLMEVTRTKWKTYGNGIKDINRLILKYAKYIDHPSFEHDAFDSLTPHEKYHSTVSFPDPLPKDELVDMQLMVQKIKSMLMSRKDALVKLGVPNPEEKLQEIMAENKQIENLIYDGQYEDFDSYQELADALNLNIGGQLGAEEQVNPNDSSASE